MGADHRCQAVRPDRWRATLYRIAAGMTLIAAVAHRRRAIDLGACALGARGYSRGSGADSFLLGARTLPARPASRSSSLSATTGSVKTAGPRVGRGA
jgi:hypothetical protein